MKDFSRYIFEKRHFSVENQRVKPSAFVPWPHVETSVADIKELKSEEIWTMGDTFGQEGSRNLSVIARGDFDATDVLNSGLKLTLAEPPERHWHIIGWNENSKDAQKAQALELAPLAELHVRGVN
jgi:hypothetical protein